MKKIARTIGLLLLSVILGTVLLTAVVALPTEKAVLHVWQSLGQLESEYDDTGTLDGYEASLTGNFTTCLMLEHAIYRNDAEHSILEQALYMYRGESSEGDGWAPGYSLVDYVEAVEQPREVEYARYWHGYLLVLKPLLMLTSLNSLRILNAAVQMILLALVLRECFRRREDFLGIGLACTIPFLYYFSMYLSMSLSICYYVVMISLLLQLKGYAWLVRRGFYGEFFLLVGIATCYFDFLTYPLVCLGLPLCVYLYLDRSSWKVILRKLVGYSAEWSIGYLGMWVSKWLITDLLTGGNVIRDGIATMAERTSGISGQSLLDSYLQTLQENCGAYANSGFAVLLIGIAVWIMCGLWRGRSRITRQNRMSALVLSIVAFYPFVWFLMTQNHSSQHWMFTCKILAVSVFASICAAGKLVQNSERNLQT